MSPYPATSEKAMKTYKVLSVLLDYPEEALARAVPELREVLDAERLLPQPVRAALEPLLQELETRSTLELQERYVGLFDRVRSLSLNLFEHVHGESRDRGQALVDLKALYARHGLVFAVRELPDYLPAFLEFLSRIPTPEARTLLAETSAILAGIRARLARRGSCYAAAFDALLALAGSTARADDVPDEEIRKEDDPSALDAAWEEQPAFGPASGCGAGVRPADAVIRFHPRAPEPRTRATVQAGGD